MREIIVGVALLVLVALYGRKTILKIVKEGFGLKKDLKDIAEGKDIKD